jgi:1-acyl-sn-glycerol-3-phosphate acyltransferase
MVLIFGEGWCEQNWYLRPLKKGSARIAERARSEPQTEKTVIIPIGLTYEHFDGGGKSVVLNVGKAITSAENTQNESGATFVKWLNSRITESLKTLAYFNPMLQINSTDHQQLMRS